MATLGVVTSVPNVTHLLVHKAEDAVTAHVHSRPGCLINGPILERSGLCGSQEE
jgi:hypothetical protein